MTPPTAPERCQTCDREGCSGPFQPACGDDKCDVSDTIRRALDGDEGGMRAPYHGPLAVVLRYPSIAADLRRLDEVPTIGSPRAAAMRDAAAQWAKVAPLIERLDRAAMVGASHAELLDAVADVCAVRRPTIDEATP